jgi:TatD DNase family protein
VRRLPPLDMHAHVDPHIPSEALDQTQAVVFAVTRSLVEAAQAVCRADSAAVWGVGCHPGLIKAQAEFSSEVFSELLESSAFAGELGLDGQGRVPLAIQRKTLSSALDVLLTKKRIVSLHSYAACSEILEELGSATPNGVILHWWLGTSEQTRQAVALGCYFSANAASVRQLELHNEIPLGRILTETDHPFGDRQTGPRRPGAVLDVERRLAEVYGLSSDAMRLQVWRNLACLVRTTESARLLPQTVRVHLAAI